MRLYFLRNILFCLSLSYATVGLATNGVSVGYGTGTKEVQAYRFGIQRSWANDGVTHNRRRITGYWELGFTQMHNPIQYSFPTNNNLEATSFSLVLRVPFRICLNWYIDIGLGLAYLTNEEISTRNLGARWLFEDRLGFGALFGQRQQVEIGYRLLHFSNGYLAQVNQGINLHLLILGYWFR